MRRKVLYGRVCSKHPSVLVFGELFWVVQVHLNQVLIETIRASAPSSVAVHELTVLGTDLVPDQSRERLRASGRTKHVQLGGLRELGVFLVPCQIAEARPLQNQRAEASDGVRACAADTRLWVQVDYPIRYAAGRVECNAQTVPKSFGLLEESFHFFWVCCKVLHRALQEVVA